MKFSPTILLHGHVRSVKIKKNSFDGIFITVLLLEIFCFICYENNTTSDVILHDFLKSVIDLKSSQNITPRPGYYS